MSSGVSVVSKGLMVSDVTLRSYGCVNCVWKTYGQCPQGFTKVSQSLPEGYCDEFSSFFISFANKDDSISALKEKFMLYVQEMQALADHTKYRELQEKYDIARKEGYDEEELAQITMAIQMYKMWWSRLTEAVVKGLSRIADRERRSSDVQPTSKITVQQLNILLKESSENLKQLEHTGVNDDGKKRN